jgi:uncharacterized protein YutE (UPF0331/DUF86 family)
MDERVVNLKLESLRKCISRVESKTPASQSDLDDDLDLQDIISVNLERGVQLCVDIGTHIIASSEKDVPDTMGGTFDLLSELEALEQPTADVMKKAVGFRNIAVHNYEKINWAIVYSICTKQLKDFKRFAREIDTYISDL